MNSYELDQVLFEEKKLQMQAERCLKPKIELLYVKINKFYEIGTDFFVIGVILKILFSNAHVARNLLDVAECNFTGNNFHQSYNLILLKLKEVFFV